MTLPAVTNNTCDIYRSGNAPPAAPDVAAVPIFLKPDWQGAHDKGFYNVNALMWTHIAYMGPTVDIRDKFQGAMTSADLDTVWIPDQNGTRFKVIFVQRISQGTAGDHKQVFLDRHPAPTWPTNNL
jgi:hypothetical protein